MTAALTDSHDFELLSAHYIYKYTFILELEAQCLITMYTICVIFSLSEPTIIDKSPYRFTGLLANFCSLSTFFDILAFRAHYY